MRSRYRAANKKFVVFTNGRKATISLAPRWNVASYQRMQVQRDLNKVTNDGPELILPAVNNQKELF